jgi:hypothetical protein
MALYLIESTLEDSNPEHVQQKLDRVAETATAHRSELIEAQVGEALDRLFVVIEAQNAEIAQQAFENSGFTAVLLKEVRLIGQDLNITKLRKGKANYLVEWNLPAGLTMEAYLKRKAEKSPLYAQVPEVKFERTYVCEDMSKCLCFYDSPDETTVKQAREVVSAPIDTLTPIRNLH